MTWLLAGAEDEAQSWSEFAAWQLVDAAAQAGGWLVEPALANGQIELLTASLQLSQAAELLVDPAAHNRPHIPLPDSEEFDAARRELLSLVAAARDRVVREPDASGRPSVSGQVALLLEQAHHTLEGSLR